MPSESNNNAIGSAFILNGLSFSGCDIKAVIHVYDSIGKPNSILNTRIGELKADIQATTTKQTAILNEINSLKVAGEKENHLQIETLKAKDAALEIALQGLGAELSRYESISARDSDSQKMVTKTLAEIQTLTVSTSREKVPVRALGHVYPKGFTRGPRMIAGSMIFTVFNKHVLYSMLQSANGEVDFGGASTALLDQLPPFDITIAFANEYGAISRMAILGCEFVNEGQTMSIEDIFLENVTQFVARDVDPMRSVAQRNVDRQMQLTDEFNINSKRASDLLDESDFIDRNDILNPFHRRKLRSNIYA